MADPVPHDRPLSVEEYLAFELSSPARHEFVDGYVYAMSGPSRRHSRIAMNVGARLWAAARGGPCRVHQAEIKLRIGRNFYYPDGMVACGPEPDDPYVEDAPCLAVEVTSPSTARTDRREKVTAYTTLPSLGAYLVVDQDRRLVDRHWRDDAGWHRETLVGHGAIALPCPALTLTLDEIYEGVEFPPPEEARRVREEAEAYR
jgi:Uma2 family endonuclease